MMNISENEMAVVMRALEVHWEFCENDSKTQPKHIAVLLRQEAICCATIIDKLNGATIEPPTVKPPAVKKESRKIYNMREAAEYVGMSYSAFANLRAENRMPVSTGSRNEKPQGVHLKFLQEELDEWLSSRGKIKSISGMRDVGIENELEANKRKIKGRWASCN